MLLALTLASSGLFGCTTAAQVEAHNEATLAELTENADRAFSCLVEQADERGIAAAQIDERRRRLTSEWIEDGADARHRYIMSVITGMSGLAMRVRLSRQVAGEGADSWLDVEASESDNDEEMAIIQASYTRWTAGGCLDVEPAAP